tara:strand:+ start:3183 stop:4148 length:966 start_codon:yes stop_codon:yes gene_type:complete
MKKYIFPCVIALSALSVSASAAFYSVFGLSKLFAGASTEVIIMAGSLEAAKLVIASLLYQYWSEINKLLRAYLLIATITLITITSGGIYGFLSGAYQETATQSEFLEKEVSLIQKKKERFETQSVQLREIITTTTTSLSNPTMIQYVDKESGQLITTTSSRVRNMLQDELKVSKTQLAAVNDSITKLDLAILSQQINNEAARELGPLKYMAELTDQSMDKIVNWFMILIIFVFDPLAIALVVAANVAFNKIKPKEKVIDFDKQVEMSCPPGLEFNTPYTLEEIKEKWIDETDNKEYVDTQIKKLRQELNDNNIMSHNQTSN